MGTYYGHGNPLDPARDVLSINLSAHGRLNVTTPPASLPLRALLASDPRCLRYPPPPSPSPLVARRALAPCSLASPSSPSLQPCAAVASVVAVARGGHHRGRQVVAVLVRPSAVAVDRRNTVAVVKPKSAAASSSSPTSFGHRPSPFRSSVSSPRRPHHFGALRSRRRAVVRRRACVPESSPVMTSPLTSSSSFPVARSWTDGSWPSILDESISAVRFREPPPCTRFTANPSR
uniref:Root cap protein 1-like n=1 Tax=Oryza sativa subsp. japonica TaxID=39947 RepID=Q6K392_ORYSJ|nr:root cap protein 1-like [Oryza sativa Japonica Group]BAD22426.1 root cap protein 1-like [Oryza sativa Japonica Group]